MGALEVGGEVSLFAPADWFDLMEDGADLTATRARCAELVRVTYPSIAVERREDFTNALMALHKALLADGVLMYGTITAPLPSTGAQAAWQVYAGVVEVPSSPAELDLAELMVQIFGEQYGADSGYTEAFTTDMGLGFGFIAQPSVQLPGDAVDEMPRQPRVGLAGALACPVGGVKGLLVIGTSLDAEQVGEMAGLVAAIAGRSVFVEAQAGR